MSGMNANEKLYVQKLSYDPCAAPYQSLALPWWVTTPGAVYFPRHRCHLEPLICGEAVFGRIAKDLEEARHSVDIVTWGFDPGMVLVRNGSAENGVRYGELLKQIASREDCPVVVRLLLWHDDMMSHGKMKNNPYYYGPRYPCIGGPAGYLGEEHEHYNAQWFDEVRAGKFPNICLHVREVPMSCRTPALADEKYESSAVGWLGSLYPTHHQKMVLVDYEKSPKAVGYVMGHNSVTDFWDTAEHCFQDPRRETVYKKNPAGMRSQWDPLKNDAAKFFYGGMMPGHAPDTSRERERVYKFMKENATVAKPYQDVSLRLRGPILYDLNHNFCQGWEESRPSSQSLRLALWLTAPAELAAKAVNHVADASLSTTTPLEIDSGFIERRRKLKLSNFNIPYGKHSAQLMRTQPMHKEKTVKECYANFSRLVQHYIFIQNQYIQYEEWATPGAELMR